MHAHQTAFKTRHGQLGFQRLVTCVLLPVLPCSYDLQNARDAYRFASGPEGMNRRLLLRYIEVRADSYY